MDVDSALAELKRLLRELRRLRLGASGTELRILSTLERVARALVDRIEKLKREREILNWRASAVTCRGCAMICRSLDSRCGIM